MLRTTIRAAVVLVGAVSLGAVAWAQTTRVSVATGGAQGTGRSFAFSVSADGGTVAYYSHASNLVPGDTNGTSDCFVTTYPGLATERVSVSSAGAQTNGGSPDVGLPDRPAISSSGRFVAFASLATNLDPSTDLNTANDVFLRDRQAGTTTRVSRVLGGYPNGASKLWPGSITPDGRYVVFESLASNLVPNDTNNTWDVFVRDMVGGGIERASVTSTGAQGNFMSQRASISEDGRYVLFQSLATNLGNESNGAFDVFVRDRLLGSTTIVSAGPIPGQGTVYFGGEDPTMSSDGRFVAFRTTANVAPGDTSFDPDVYWKDLQTGTLEWISVDPPGTSGFFGNQMPSVSWDGRFVAFESNNPNFVPGDTNGNVDAFVKDRLLGTIERLSVSTSEAQANGNSSYPMVSSSGNVVVFSSNATNLVGSDTNAVEDGFVRGLLPRHDTCAEPLWIYGPGQFPISAAQATTGLDGQEDAGCGPGMPRDLWFVWTSTFDGFAVIDTCPASGDTKLAVRGLAGCPPAPVHACDDDGCGTAGGGALVRLPVFTGGSYVIQVATVSGTGAGVLRITNPPAYDDCATPLAIAGSGPFAYDTTLATTGVEGQSDSGCGPGLYKDVWFSWTAPYSGDAMVNTCFGPGTQGTKAAVYAGGGCPSGPPLACNDDACLIGKAVVCFPVTAGAVYLIQLGSETPVGEARTFEIWNAGPAVTGACTPLDLGTSTSGLGYAGGGSVGWLQRFGEVGGSTTVSAISTAWGSANESASTHPANGSPARVAIWDDPDEDGVPDDAVLLQIVDVNIAGSGTDALQTVGLSPPVPVSGYYFVGAGLAYPDGDRPAPVEEYATCSGWGRAWQFASFAQPLDYANLSANPVPPTKLEDIGFIGQLLLRPTCLGTDPFVLFCPGDGTGTPCPCGNPSTVGAHVGCLSSLGTGGRLRASGIPSIASDTMTLLGTQMPNSSALFFQGTSQQSGGAGAVFGDGLRCTGGTVIRLGTKVNTSGASQYPVVGDPPISIAGTNSAGATRTYQIWYRNSATFCTSSTFNLTNGLQTTWLP